MDNLTPFSIKDARKKFQPFLISADNYKGSDDAAGVIRSKGEIERSVELACGFPASSAYKEEARTCIELINDLKNKTGFRGSGLTSHFEGRSQYVRDKNAIAEKLFDSAIEQKVKVAESYAGKALIALENKNLVKAENLFKKALDIDPNYALAHVGLAFLFANKKNLVEAEQHAKRALELDPENSRANRIFGRLLLSRHDLNGAEKYLQKAIRSDPRDYQSYIFLTDCYFDKDLNKALKFANLALKWSPEGYKWIPMIKRGEIFTWLKKFNEGLSDLDAALKLKTSGHNALFSIYHNRAVCLIGLGRYGSALESLNEAARSDPKILKNYSYLNGKGDLLIKLNRYDEAIPFLARAIDLEPKNPLAYYNISIALAASNAVNEILKYAKLALARGVKSAILSENLANMALKIILLNRKIATELTDTAIKLGPESPDGYHAKAFIVFISGEKRDKIGALMDRAISLCKDNKCRDLRMAKAQMLMCLENLKEAFRELRWLKDNNHKGRDYYLSMAFYHFESKEFSKAFSYLRKAEASGKDFNTELINCLFKLKDDPVEALNKFEKLEKSHVKNTMKRISKGPKITIGPMSFFITAGFQVYSKFRKDTIKKEFKGNYLIMLKLLFMAGRRGNDILPYLDRYISSFPNDFTGHFMKGNALLDEGKNDEAEETFKKAISLKKGIGGLHVQYGLTLANLGRWKSAIEQFNIARKLDPDLSIAVVNNCYSIGALGDTEGALACINDAIKRFPNDGEAYRVKAECLSAKKRHKDALRFAKKAISLSPKNRLVHSTAGGIFRALDDPLKALASFDRAIEIDPYHKDFYVEKIFLLSILNKVNAIKTMIETFSKLFPDSGHALIFKGLIEDSPKKALELLTAGLRTKEVKSNNLLKLTAIGGRLMKLALIGDYKQAGGDVKILAEDETLTPTVFIQNLKGMVFHGAEHYEETLKIYELLLSRIKEPKKKITVHCDIGHIYVRRGEFDKAVANIKKALSIDPNSLEANYAMASVMERQRNLPQVMKYLDKVIEKDPSYQSALRNKASLIWIMGKDPKEKAQEALNFIDNILGKKVYDRERTSEVHVLKGYILVNTGKPSEAIQAFDKALEYDHENHSAFMLKGVTLLDILKKYNEAATAFEKASQLRPRDFTTSYYLAKAYFLQGKYLEAAILLDEKDMEKRGYLEPYLLKAAALSGSNKDESRKEALRLLNTSLGLKKAFDADLPIVTKKAIDKLREKVGSSLNIRRNLTEIDTACDRIKAHCEAVFGGTKAIQDMNRFKQMRERDYCMSISKTCGFEALEEPGQGSIPGSKPNWLPNSGGIRFNLFEGSAPSNGLIENDLRRWRRQ